MKHFFIRYKRLLIWLLPVVGIFIFAFVYYQQHIAATRIALINYPSFTVARMQKANDSRWVKLQSVAISDLSSVSGYDVALVFGRGLHLTALQSEQMRKAGRKGLRIFEEAAADPQGDLTNLSDSQRTLVTAYMRNGGNANYRNLLHYARISLDGKKYAALPAASPVNIASDVLFHVNEEIYFSEVAAYESWLQSNHLFKMDAPRIALVTSVPGPFNANRDHLDSIITVFQRRGWNVYPMAGNKRRLEFLQAIHPDIVVEMPHGRLAPGNSPAVVAWLNQQNIPVLSPISVFMNYDQWKANPQGMNGGLLTMSIVSPELDGAVAPYAIVAQYKDENGYDIFRAIPERLDRFTDLISRWLSLKNKPNRDKKIAIYYFKGPGLSSLVAGNLEVAPSLYNTLLHLQQKGYTVENLPKDAAALNQLIQKSGSILNPYAAGNLQKFFKEGSPAWINVSTYEKWAKSDLEAASWKSVLEKYGQAPGSYMQETRGDTAFLAVARLSFGNVVLLPQPLPAIGENTFKIVHGAKVAPPHPYIASYLWTRHVFQPDAIIHFGTHGSLEFTPGKQVALGNEDWSDALIGTIPHFYVYTMSNVGEAIIAKRRSYATILSHLTPPFMHAGGSTEVSRLEEELHRWDALEEGALKTAYANTISQSARKLGYYQEMELDTAITLTTVQLTKLQGLVEEMVNEKVNSGLYTIGKPYTKMQAERTASLMSGADTGRAKYVSLLLASTDRELAALDNALSGGYTLPGAGGDPLANPGALPTGRNLFSIDAEKTPGLQAWQVGVQLAKDLVAQYQSEHKGAWPRKVALTLWPGEFIRTEGAMLAEIFYLLGVAPVRDPQGRITDLGLIPSSELQRPRIDVVVQTAGQFRDLAASRLELINRAVALAAAAADKTQPNYVSDGVQAGEKMLKQKGFTPKEARQMASLRVFGGINGNYGTGIMSMVESGDRYNNRDEVANVYIHNMGAAYNDTSQWALFREGLFEAALQHTDVVVQPRESNTWGPLSLDHVYEFMGGLNNAVRLVTGKEPTAVLNDFRNPVAARVQPLKEAVWVEARSTLLNPVWIKDMQQGESSSAEKMTETVRNIFGWNVMKPTVIDNELWDQLHEVYIRDRYQLNTSTFFEKQNPAALEELTGVMMEAARKGLWKATPVQRQEIARLHATLVSNYGAGCTEFVCGNAALRQEMQHYVPQEIKGAYTSAVNAALQPNGTGQQGAAVVLKKTAQTTEGATIHQQSSSNWRTLLFIVAAVAIVGLVLIRKKK
ncbi:CobN/magnesium chelatase [Chitinophaga dinghuensis]|uniref:CobN/magnesium chelatase n=1 Tax=Chitinophaga dinghuensis TaxID=1539050 RepID=A0A327VYB5_9BACT|nr:cobaltochelatase subunit CobN [Chitinophaga dinghuensis]RAJ80190.1 CobN/magnesium chelatase [Chitinophaga dinghuensis]